MGGFGSSNNKKIGGLENFFCGQLGHDPSRNSKFINEIILCKTYSYPKVNKKLLIFRVLLRLNQLNFLRMKKSYCFILVKVRM